jgi:hypothetical protein
MTTLSQRFKDLDPLSSPTRHWTVQILCEGIM